MDPFLEWEILPVLVKAVVIASGLALGVALPHWFATGRLDKFLQRFVGWSEPLERVVEWASGPASTKPPFRPTWRQRFVFAVFFFVVVFAGSALLIGVLGALGHVILPMMGAAMVSFIGVVTLSLIAGSSTRRK